MDACVGVREETEDKHTIVIFTLVRLMSGVLEPAGGLILGQVNLKLDPDKGGKLQLQVQGRAEQNHQD